MSQATSVPAPESGTGYDIWRIYWADRCRGKALCSGYADCTDDGQGCGLWHGDCDTAGSGTAYDVPRLERRRRP
jgi:hypothetical protein